MNKLIIMALLATIASVGYSQSDNVPANHPELSITEDQKRLEATFYCVDVQIEVAQHNEFALQFISLPNFPQKTASITKEQLTVLVDKYFQDHPDLVDKVRIARKEAHDKIYGTRPY